MQIIKTSNPNWLKYLAKAYKQKTTITLINDANLNIDPETETILTMGRKANLTKTQWFAVLVSLGVSTAGLYIVYAAIMDPEPTSKLLLMISGGIALIGTGGVTAIGILTKKKPPHIEVSKDKFIISWNETQH